MKKVLFRADSSSSIGTGHIMRDLVLASKFKKQNPNLKIVFVVQDLDGNINHKIIEASYALECVNSNDKQELLKLIEKLEADLLVIDSYDIDSEFEKYIKENSKIKILSFDDTYEKHHCDILLNHNISADKKKYKSLVPKNCELRCGSKYTLLRDEFYKEKNKKYKKSKKHKRVFIAMGGADTAELNIPILKVLKNFKNIKAEVVTTNANKNLKKLQKYCKNEKWINLHINSNKIAKLMKKSDIAIVTPSVTVNEVHFMKLPFIAIKTAANQDDIYRYLKKKKFLVLKEFNKEKLTKLIEKKLNIPAKTLERWIKQLKTENKIEYKGSKKTGGYYAR